MKKILLSIGKGALNGFPVIQSIVREVKKSKGEPLSPIDPVTGVPIKQSFNVISLIAEIGTVALIIAFVAKKITIDELMQLRSLLGGN